MKLQGPTMRARQHKEPAKAFANRFVKAQSSLLFYLLLSLWIPGCGNKTVPPPADKLLMTQLTSTQAQDGWSVNYPKQRKIFFAHKLLWLFYSDGRDAVLRTSSDGLTWSAPTKVQPNGHFGHRTGYWFDGTYFHYAHNAAGAGESVIYRRGKAESTGTITWSTPQTVMTIPSGHNVMYPKVIVDTKGHPWVSFVHCKGGPHDPPYDAVIVKSATNDGTWNTAKGFPTLLVQDNPKAYPDLVGAPMTAGKTFWVVNKDKPTSYLGRRWDGTRWQSEETLSTKSSYGLFNVVADADTLHVAYGGGAIHYRQWTQSTGWSKPEWVGVGSGHVSLTLADKDRIFVSWLDKHNHLLLYRERRNATWQTTVQWADESQMGLSGSATTVGINLNGILHATPSLLLANAYTTGTKAPYQLKFIAIRR